MAPNKQKARRHARATESFFNQVPAAPAPAPPAPAPSPSPLRGPASAPAPATTGPAASPRDSAKPLSVEALEAHDPTEVETTIETHLIKTGLLARQLYAKDRDSGGSLLGSSLRVAYSAAGNWRVDWRVIAEISRGVFAGEIEHLSVGGVPDGEDDKIIVIAPSYLSEDDVLLILVKFFYDAAGEAVTQMTLNPSFITRRTYYPLYIIGLITLTAWHQDHSIPLLTDNPLPDGEQVQETGPLYLNLGRPTRNNLLISPSHSTATTSTLAKPAKMSPLSEQAKAANIVKLKELSTVVEGLNIKDTAAVSTANGAKATRDAPRRPGNHATVEDVEDETTPVATRNVARKQKYVSIFDDGEDEQTPAPTRRAHPRKKHSIFCDDDEEKETAYATHRSTTKKQTSDTTSDHSEIPEVITAEEAFGPRSRVPRSARHVPSTEGYEGFQAHRAAQAAQAAEAAQDAHSSHATDTTNPTNGTQTPCATHTTHTPRARQSARPFNQQEAHARLVAHLNDLVNQDFPNPQARRAALARAKQQILRSETLAAARGTQRLRPTATRATEEVKTVGRDDARRAALAEAGFKFDIGGMPGWAGELERMQALGLRRSGNAQQKKKTGGGDDKKEEEDKDKTDKNGKGKD